MAEEPDLFGDEEGAPSPFSDALAAAAERRGIGRPRGARNRKSVDFEKLYYAKGYRDPLLVLGEIVSAGVLELRALAAELDGEAPDVLSVIAAITKAANDLAPYLHGKMPTRIEVTDERLPILMMALGTNQLDEAKALQLAKALSAGQLIEGEALENPANPGVSEGEE